MGGWDNFAGKQLGKTVRELKGTEGFIGKEIVPVGTRKETKGHG